MKRNYNECTHFAEMAGHDILAVERYQDDTRHMVEFQVHAPNSQYGDAGARVRLFLTEEGYQKMQDSQKCGDIKIRRHACVIEGHILYDRKKEHSR